MSAFTTEIPVDIEGVKRLLPKDSYIESVTWNKDTQRMELVWSNHKLRTPYNIPTPFPVQDLHDKKLPKCVTIRGTSDQASSVQQPQTIATNQANNATDNVKDVDVKPKRGVKKQQT